MINILVTYFMKKTNSTFVKRIDWDFIDNTFIISKPRGVFGSQRKVVGLGELVFDNNGGIRDCIYYNTNTGEGYATVNRGTWYNEAIFLHLMQKLKLTSTS